MARARGRLDIALVPTLDALLTEKNVTRAAQKLGVTQSAVSHALRKLRDHFGDELLVRTPSGLVLTPRAERLAESVRKSLEVLDEVDADQPFDPKTAKATFTIAMADFVAIVLLPTLLERLGREAPGVDIVVRPLTAESERALESGAIDLLVAGARSAPAGCYRQKILDDGWVALVREDHPVLHDGLDRERYAALGHVLVAPRGSARGPVDDALEEAGLTRRIAVRVPQLHLGAFLLIETDFVMTTVAAAGRVVAYHLPLAVLDVPLDLPRVTWMQLWHERSQKDEGHAWLRGILAECAPHERGSRSA